MPTRNEGATGWRWGCRLADAFGVTMESVPSGERRSGDDITDHWSGPTRRPLRWLVHLARRHAVGCDRCQAEQAHWARIVEQMQTARDVKAPTSIYNKVMTEIGRSSASAAPSQGRDLRVTPQAIPRMRGRGSDVFHRDATVGKSGDVSYRSASSVPTWPLFSTGVWVAVVASFGLGTWLKHATSFGRWAPLVVVLDRLVVSVGDGIGEAIRALHAAFPPAVEPLVTACIWGGAGWAMTRATLSMLEKMSRRA